MKELLTSAAKLVFMLMTATACFTFIIGRLDAKDFMALAIMVFTFYFANKGDNAPNAGK